MSPIATAWLLAAAPEAQSKNPIVPALSEIVWGAIAFVALFVLLYKLAWPAIKKGLDARVERIRTDLDTAERSRDEAQGILDQYQRQLTDAKTEAARIIEESRQAADQVRNELRRKAEEEVAEIKQQAQQDITAQVDRALTGLRRQVAELSIELAEKVVEHSLDRETNLALIERFIDDVGSQR